MCNATTTNFIVIKCTDYAMSRECEITTIGWALITILIMFIIFRYTLTMLTKNEELK